MRETTRDAAMSRKLEPSRGPEAGVNDAVTRESVLERVRSAVEGIRFGEVRVIIHDGVIVQIERLEKERLR
jgi:hypothetical protein